MTDPDALLVRVKTGGRLDIGHARRALRGFLQREDEELKGVALMTLRASFATAMLRGRAQREVFKNKTEGQFLDHLSKLMNTSREQLAESCAASCIDAFETETE